MVVNVKNLNGTSDNPHPAGYLSWIDFWERNTGRKANSCSCVSCINKAAVGAHVKKVYGQNNWYIVPLCYAHNSSSSDFSVNSEDLVPVNG